MAAKKTKSTKATKSANGKSKAPKTTAKAKVAAKKSAPAPRPARPARPARPTPPPWTKKEMKAAQAKSLKKLVAACERMTHEEAEALLRKRKLTKLEWFPGEAPDGVLLHKGNLTLDQLDLDHRKDGVPDGLIVDGNLTVDVIENGEQDFGPFLVVLGDLKAKNVAVGGAPIEVTGNLAVSGTFHGYYNHGITTVKGDVAVNLLIADDYLFRFKGKWQGKDVIDNGSVEGKVGRKKAEPESVLHAAFFDAEEPTDLNSHAIYGHVAMGGSVRR
jgi:hypothetical protein